MKKRMKPFVAEAGPLKGKTIEMADTTQIESLDKQIQIVLAALGHPEAWVTDLSSVGDFCLDDEQLEELAKQFGIAVTHDTLLTELAMAVIKPE